MPIRGNRARLLTVLALVLAAKASLGWSEPGQSARSAGLGSRLFHGFAPLHGRLYTQSDELPNGAARCANCHAYANSTPVPYSSAPRLSAQWLIVNRPRRGGPKSYYNQERFCSLLRTGVDPAYIVINVEMPRYELTDEECNALWVFLTGPSHAA